MSLPDKLLDAPAHESVRRIALAFLTDASDSFRRWSKHPSADALHGFRVAVRRLRSTLRAYRPFLMQSVDRKLRRRLTRVAAATSASRDLDVQIAWLRDERGHADLLAQLEETKLGADKEPRDELEARWPSLDARLRKRLTRYKIRLDLAEPKPTPSFAQVAGQLASEHVNTLEARLRAICSRDDYRAAHRARVAGKRLRYLLEPLAASVVGVPDVIESLKKLQDVLGELQDGYVFRQSISDHSLDERIRERQRDAFVVLRRDWLDERSSPLWNEIRSIARMLTARGTEHLEIERKYLLTRVPPTAREAPMLELEQGYLPGDRVADRVRRVHSDGTDQFFRAVKARTSSSIARIEVEEETSREVFAALWRLTVGRRVRKRRYKIKDDGLLWEIDEFTDRELVLAEVELPAESEEVTVPAWLTPFVVREVTDEPEYLNINLAR